MKVQRVCVTLLEPSEAIHFMPASTKPMKSGKMGKKMKMKILHSCIRECTLRDIIRARAKDSGPSPGAGREEAAIRDDFKFSFQSSFQENCVLLSSSSIAFARAFACSSASLASTMGTGKPETVPESEEQTVAPRKGIALRNPQSA